MMYSPETIIKMVDNADHETLLMSKMNCHAMGVHSIVLDKTGGRLTRLFCATAVHGLWWNAMSTNFEVGVHDHVYHLELSHVSGNVIHMKYVESSLEGARLKKYIFTSKGCNETPHIEPAGSRLLFLSSLQPLRRCEHLGCNELHTIYCDIGKCASWVVEEGDKVKDKTTLYTNTEQLIKKDMYQPFPSVETVRKFVHDFYGSVWL